jgi:hypothetical protein
MLGNEVLALARDGVPLGLSIGFAEVPGGTRWSADRQRVTRIRAALDHVAVVRVRPMRAPGWQVCVPGDTPNPPPRRSLRYSCAVGKSGYYYSAPTGPDAQPLRSLQGRATPPPMRNLARPCLTRGCTNLVRGSIYI